ncbi:MAG TPA: GNAT family N-acetyltransferase [Candidatus Korarchaeota archaeon]|nr:GNAT family N-acetyltransferase [Candidatus Korarchaeota archaeon]
MIEVVSCREAGTWYSILKRCFGRLEGRSLEDLKAVTDSPDFDPSRLLLARVDGKPAGCIWIKGLLRGDRFELLDLAVLKEYWGAGVEDALLERVFEWLSEREARLLRAHTLSIGYYVSAYKRHGFKPVRRILRIVWETKGKGIEPMPSEENSIEIDEVRSEDLDVLPSVFAESLKPYWDWWIEDYGGEERLKEISRSWFEPSSGLIWLVARRNEEILGLTGLHVKDKEGVFFGVMVLPEHRLRGVGWVLMKSALNKLVELGLERLSVYTMAYLDHLAPGALLYLKSGGKIEAEYIQLEKLV